MLFLIVIMRSVQILSTSLCIYVGVMGCICATSMVCLMPLPLPFLGFPFRACLCQALQYICYLEGLLYPVGQHPLYSVFLVYISAEF